MTADEAANDLRSFIEQAMEGQYMPPYRGWAERAGVGAECIRVRMVKRWPSVWARYKVLRAAYHQARFEHFVELRAQGLPVRDACEMAEISASEAYSRTPGPRRPKSVRWRSVFEEHRAWFSELRTKVEIAEKFGASRHSVANAIQRKSYPEWLVLIGGMKAHMFMDVEAVRETMERVGVLGRQG